VVVIFHWLLPELVVLSVTELLVWRVQAVKRNGENE